MSMYPIASTTVGSGGSSSITFSSIPQNFTHLQIRAFARTARATYGDDYLSMQVGNNTVDTGNNYTVHSLYGDGSSATSTATAPYNYLSTGYGFAGAQGASNVFGNAIFDFLDYSNTSKNKTVRMIGGTDVNGTIAGYGGKVGLSSGVWMNTSAINVITIYGGSANLSQYSRFDLYGITNSPATGA